MVQCLLTGTETKPHPANLRLFTISKRHSILRSRILELSPMKTRHLAITLKSVENFKYISFHNLCKPQSRLELLQVHWKWYPIPRCSPERLKDVWERNSLLLGDKERKTRNRTGLFRHAEESGWPFMGSSGCDATATAPSNV